jgi:Ribonuclease G/E
MSTRRAYVDEGIGESRGVVTLDDAPERLLIRRPGDEPRLQLGARVAAIVASVEPALSSAFVDLGDGLQAILPFKAESRPVRGQAVAVEIRGESRGSKLATVRLLGPAEGRPRLLAAAPPLAELLGSYAADGRVVTGAAARRAADEAEAEALETLHPMPGGGPLAIEPTRALTAIDVDLGERKGGDAKRVTRQANLTAIAMAARLLRLKSLGGLVVIDFAGRGHEPASLINAARLVFAPDNPGVAIGGIGRFGALELSLPRRTRPVAEILCAPSGRPTPQTLALRLLRRLLQEAEAQRGARLRAVCAPAVAVEAQALSGALSAIIGARFEIVGDPAAPAETIEVSAR